MRLSGLFPFSYKARDLTNLIVSLIIYIAIPAVLGLFTSLLGWIPVVGWLLGIVSGLVGLYCLIGLVLAVLVFLKIVKD